MAPKIMLSRKAPQGPRFFADQANPSGTIASSQTVNEAGQPTQKFLKELTRAGTYVVQGDRFTITPAMLDQFAASFSRMKAAGVKVPVPAGHTLAPDANRGWVDDIYRDGEVLMGVLELVGADAIQLAGRADVSICAEPNWQDGKGQKYEWAITHVAMTPVPVVNGLGAFVKIAASRDGGREIEAPVYRLDRTSNGENAMDWSKIEPMIGADAGSLTDDNAAEKIGAYISKLKEDARKDMSREKPAAAHPQVIRLSVKNRTSEINRLSAAGKLSKVAATKLTEAFIGKNNERVEFDMADGGPADAMFDQVIEILDSNSPVPLGERVNNVRALSRTAPDEPKPAHDPKCTEEMMGMAYPNAAKN